MTTLDIAVRPVRNGGFNLSLLGIELRRVLRNRRTVIFTLLFPGAMFLAFGSQYAASESMGNGNVTAYIMVAMSLYGAAMTASASGASVALERAQGWSRQLRLTPLRPASYILVKAVSALAMGAIAVAVVNVVGLVQGRAQMPVGTWIACALLTVLCTLVFAALGVFVGYLVPGETAMQVLGPALAVLAFAGNVFIPISQGSVMWTIASYTPMFGVAEITRYPITNELPWYAVVNAIVWLGVFVAGAAWRMSKDTSRV